MHENDEADYAKVPSDFPHPVALGAVPGAQPKLLVTELSRQILRSGMFAS
jgi:hypothetical protein